MLPPRPLLPSFERCSDSEDLPSPVLVTRSDPPGCNQWFPGQMEGFNHTRDLSFSLNDYSHYEVQKRPPVDRQTLESPKFSGSSVFDSRVLNPVTLLQRPTRRVNQLRKAAIHSLSPTVKKSKTEKLFPKLSKKSVKDGRVKSHAVLAGKKTAFSEYLEGRRLMDSPRFSPVEAVLTPRPPPSAKRGAANTSKRTVTPKPPTRPKHSKSPLSHRPLKQSSRRIHL